VNEFVEKEFSLHRLGDALKRLLMPLSLRPRKRDCHAKQEN
jgi:hypothetical protein